MKISLRLTVTAFGLTFFNLATATVQGQDYTYITNNGTITIIGYTGPGGAVVIPESIEGFPVRTIGGDAFEWQTNLTSIVMGNNITTIGGDAG